MRVTFLGHLMRVWCGSMIIIAHCQYSWKHRASDFWDYLYERTVNKARLSGGELCVVKWLIFSGIDEQDPKKVCKTFEIICSIAPSMPLSKRYVISGVEAAIWERKPELVEKLLDKESCHSKLLGSMSHRRLELLSNWWFKTYVSASGELLSALTPDEAVFPYVDYYARARIADTFGRNETALRLYRRALETLPQESYEYEEAANRCNDLLNPRPDEFDSKGNERVITLPKQ